MTRIQRLDGTFFFGENNQATMEYNEARGRFEISGKRVTSYGPDVGVDLAPAALTQPQVLSVRAQAQVDVVIRNVVIPGGVDTVSPAGIGAVNVVGVVQETVAPGAQGQVAVAGVVEVVCVGAANVGDFLIAAAAGAVSSAGAGHPAIGLTVGVARSSCGGGGGVIRAWLCIG